MIRLSDHYGRITVLLRSNRKKLKSLLALPLLLSFIVISCEEEPAHIGGDILPDSDFDDIAAVDTMGVEMYTMYSETETSMHPVLSYMGSIKDPYFGLTTASYVTQLQLPSAGRWPADASHIDSVKLGITIYNVVGEAELP
ncbi:MAG: DUF4270 family protein, partial [Bacteroidales bacterium]